MVYSGYGTTANVQLLLGGVDVPFFSTTNIETAMGIADVWVDVINSGASTAKKGLACDLISVELMKKGRITQKLKGLSSDGGIEGRPARTASLMREIVPPEVYNILVGGKKDPSFKTQSPSSAGEWP